MEKEKVLAVPKGLVDKNLTCGGGKFIRVERDAVYSLILSNRTFIDREQAEKDFGFKQIIPYVLIRNGSRYLLLKRTIKQAEKRLHGKYSLGIGGHINTGEKGLYGNVIEDGLYRELGEEILVRDIRSLSFSGLINDDDVEVGRVHLGLLYILDTGSEAFELPEKDKMTGRWAGAAEILTVYESLETWSQIVFDNVIGFMDGLK